MGWITPHTLKRLAAQARHYNVPPRDLGRYLRSLDHPLRHPVALSVEEALGTLNAASDEEILAVHDGLHPFLRSQVAPAALAQRDPGALREVALGIATTEVEEYYFDPRQVLAASYLRESAVFREYPELRDFHDEDGLLDLAAPGLQLSPDAITYGKHVLYCHQFLRRYFNGNPNVDFLRTLFDYRAAHSVQSVRLAIDHSRLVEIEWYYAVMEKDYWHGPQFAWTKLDDPDAVGLTVYAGPQHPLLALAGNGLERTEFLWSYRNGLKTFQAEEIHSPKRGGKLELNRYVHSIRAIERRAFVHIDGAVKAYEPTHYPARIKSQMPDEPRSARRVKLFRIDGDIPNEEWAALVSSFFRHNEMVLEYLNSES